MGRWSAHRRRWTRLFWLSLLATAAAGPFLFGAFSIADAFYAPVVSRFSTYGPVRLSPESTAFMETIRALPAMKEWGDGARAEIGG